MVGTPEDMATRTPLSRQPTVRLAARRGSTRPGRPNRRVRRRAPVLGAAAVTTVWASVVSYAPVLALVALVTTVGGGGAPVRVILRLGTAGWLLAHGVPLHTHGGPLGL